MTAPKGKGPGKRGGSKPGRTRAAASIVVAARPRPNPGRKPPHGPEVEVEGEFTETGPRPSGPLDDTDRARDILAKVRSRGGRPPEITRDLIERVVTSILRGSPPLLAFKAEGFAQDTYTDWRNRAKADLAADPPRMTLHVEFSAAVDLASGSFGQEAAEWMHRSRDTKAGSNQPSVVQFLLKSHHKAIFADRQTVELTGEGGGPVKTEITDARDAVFLAAADALGPGLTTAFLVEMRRWPTSVEEAAEWQAARAAKAAAPPTEAPQ